MLSVTDAASTVERCAPGFLRPLRARQASRSAADRINSPPDCACASTTTITFRLVPLRNPHPCLERRNRPRIRKEVTRVQALRLAQEVERACQIALRLPDASHRDAPAILVLRQSGVVAQF